MLSLKRHCLLLLAGILVSNAAHAQSHQFGDTLGFYATPLDLFVQNSVQDFDFDCDGKKDLRLEAITSNSLRRTAVYNLDSTGHVEVAVEATGKVKIFAKQDTIACPLPGFWTNFNFLVIGISGSGGSYGNCCFDHQYLGFRKIAGSDTLLGWIRLSATFTPEAILHVEELAFQQKCQPSGTQEQFTAGSTSVQPNPFGAYLWIHSIESDQGWAQCYSLIGQACPGFPVHWQSGEHIDMSKLAPGVYFLFVNGVWFKLIKDRS